MTRHGTWYLVTGTPYRYSTCTVLTRQVPGTRSTQSRSTRYLSTRYVLGVPYRGTPTRVPVLPGTWYQYSLYSLSRTCYLQVLVTLLTSTHSCLPGIRSTSRCSYSMIVYYKNYCSFSKSTLGASVFLNLRCHCFNEVLFKICCLLCFFHCCCCQRHRLFFFGKVLSPIP